MNILLVPVDNLESVPIPGIQSIRVLVFARRSYHKRHPVREKSHHVYWCSGGEGRPGSAQKTGRTLAFGVLQKPPILYSMATGADKFRRCPGLAGAPRDQSICQSVWPHCPPVLPGASFHFPAGRGER